MYFESRTYEIQDPSTSYDDLVSAIEKASDCHVHTIINKAGDCIAFVPDGHIDNPKQELAVINLSEDTLIESWTWGWVSKNDRRSSIESIANSDLVLRKDVKLNQLDKLVSFTCSCCGSTFQSTIENQKEHGQDSGYGICPKCL